MENSSLLSRKSWMGAGVPFFPQKTVSHSNERDFVRVAETYVDLGLLSAGKATR